MSVFVILPAAGIGTRMSSSTGTVPSSTGTVPKPAPKQFLSLKGLPILLHSLQAFLAVPQVTAIYVAVRQSEQPRVSQLLTDHNLTGKVHVVTGGDSRQDSVSHALAALPSTSADDIVLVHDAVRPLIDPATISRTIEAIERHGAAIVGTPAVDTIKQVERTADGALITATIPRELIVHAQTPQGARVALMRQAFTEAAADEFVGTDESSLLERAGIPVFVVQGSPRNFKVTQPGDLDIAEFYLAG
jgi:2-C-methyl-D-erythritol 4-phosphate cytidylyltransferase